MSFTKVLILTNNLYPEMGGPYNVITSTADQLFRNPNCKVRLVANYDGKNKSKLNIVKLLNDWNKEVKKNYTYVMQLKRQETSLMGKINDTTVYNQETGYWVPSDNVWLYHYIRNYKEDIYY